MNSFQPARLEPGIAVVQTTPRIDEKPRAGLIDDDIDLREASRAHLAKRDMGPEIFHYPDAMIDAVLSGTVDVLVVDIGLPGTVSGLDIMESVRSNSAIPVVVISGHTDIGTVTRALRLGADDYLRKPFHQEEFGLCLEALLNRHDPDRA